MNDTSRPSMVERSPLARLFRSLRSRQGIRRTLIVLAWMATIIALFYGEENWRGRTAWHQYRHQLEARGEQIDLKTFIPPPIPDEQNFAATPFIESWFSERTNLAKRWADDFARVEGRISYPKNNGN